MTIIEARELAMQGKTVISTNGLEWNSVQFSLIKQWSAEAVFGVWREKREPQSVFVIFDRTGTAPYACYTSKDKAEKFIADGERIVEFVEVL